MGDSAAHHPSEEDPNRPPGPPPLNYASAPSAPEEARAPLSAPASARSNTPEELPSAPGGPGGASNVPAALSNADVVSLPSVRAAGQVPPAEQNSWAGDEIKVDTPDPLLGATLQGTYAITGILGAGGMGRVYEAHHTRIASKRFAIKVLHAEFALNPELRLRFEREAEAAASIEHSGIVGTYDVGETSEGWPYMVCEYLAGGDLNAYLKEHGSLSPEAVAHIGKQLCSALGAAHSKGVIHRDLKPHNVFVVDKRDPRAPGPAPLPELPFVKVLDFGLSRFVERDNELTKTGIIIGTPGYMAPEQANGRDTDTRTDIYGIGALLYATATGRAPFGEETPQLTVLAVMNREPPPPREIEPKVPVELEIVIQKAMARDPGDRYQSAHEMGEALARLYAPLGPLNRRAERSGSRFLANPRLSLGVSVGVAVLFSALSLVSMALAALAIGGFDWSRFEPTVLEWVFFYLVGAFVLGGCGLVAYLFKRQTWDNSARVAELAPKVRASLMTGASAYGLAAFLVLLGGATLSVIRGTFLPSGAASSLVLYLVLPAVALLTTATAFARLFFARARSPFLRSLTSSILPALATLTGLWLITLPFTWQPSLSSSWRAPSSQPAEPASAPALVSERTSGPSAAVGRASTDAPNPPRGSPSETGAAASAERAATQVHPSELAPREELAIATHDGAAALEALHHKFPRDSRVLKALVLAHASRADTLDRSIQAIAQLLEVNPSSNKDTDVLFILKKALLLKGRPYAVAASAVRNQMGTEGAELLYQLMGEHPEQGARLRELFQELRKTKKAEPNVLIAYDLRYASSCHARLSLLERAEEFGDQRSLHQLQALSTAPKRCGWGKTCHPPCKNEADRFKKSAKIIARRLETVP